MSNKFFFFVPSHTVERHTAHVCNKDKSLRPAGLATYVFAYPLNFDAAWDPPRDAGQFLLRSVSRVRANYGESVGQLKSSNKTRSRTYVQQCKPQPTNGVAFLYHTVCMHKLHGCSLICMAGMSSDDDRQTQINRSNSRHKAYVIDLTALIYI